MNENFEYARIFAQFPFSLRRFLKQKITLADAKRIVRDRMQQREQNFLRMLERNVYGNPHSPYLKLLKHAGCALSDVRVLVQQKEIEGALKQLRAEGVYVTFEEFKGRKPIERNGLSLRARASDFDNPYARADFPNQSSGSTGAAVKVALDFDYIAARASNRLIALDAHGIADAPLAIWRGILPERIMEQLLNGALTNQMPQKWFSPMRLRDSSQWVKYGLGTYYLIACMHQAGLHVPLPEYVNQADAVVVARWAEAAVKKYGRCLLRAGTSRGVRVCIAAQEHGIDLTGVTFSGAGEPATEGKARQYERVGAHFISNYGMSEAGQPGAGCANRVGVSDYHLWKDACVIFTQPVEVPNFGFTVDAFHLTTILPQSPKVMLNVQTDDFGIVEERHCGCALEEYGLTTHLREIRSYSKLTGEGVTLIGTEMIHILEHILPTRFGGSALDYQLMEQEDAQGFTRLYLLVHPRVAIENESAVLECLNDALRQSSPAADVARFVWKNANTIQLKRAEPRWNPNGKFSSLYLPQRYRETSRNSENTP